MNFELLWLDGLIICLLWVAFFAAVGARFRRRWLKAVWIVPTLGVPVLLLAALIFDSAALRFTAHVTPNWFGASVLLTAAFLAGAAWIVLAARRPVAGEPAARRWPLLTLVGGAVAALAIGYTTLVNMDLIIRARCAIECVDVHATYLASLPAIVSEADNAAPLYQQAFARLTADMPMDLHNPPVGDGDRFDPNEPATISFLAREADTIRLLRKAASLPACRFSQDQRETDLSAIMSQLNIERHAANVLHLDAEEQLVRNHPEVAIEDAQAILRMSRQFGQRPLLVSALVGLGIDAVGNKALEKALPAAKSPADLGDLDLDQITPIGRVFSEALRGEEAFGLATYGQLPPSGNQAGSEGPARGSLGLLSASSGVGGMVFRVFCIDSDAYIELMETLQSLASEPFYSVKQRWDEQISPLHTRDVLMNLLAPALERALTTCGRVDASDRCAKVALAITRYRLDHGSLPRNVADFVPKYLAIVPTDPFDGQPLRIKLEPKVALIYSVGPDGVDDGGRQIEHGKGDVTFTLRLAQSTGATQP